MRLTFRLMLALAALALSSVAFSAGNLRVSIGSAAQQLSDTDDLTMTVTFTNEGRASAKLLRWITPSDELSGPLFQITRDGAPVTYLGPIAKRAAPTADDYITLSPGESVSYEVELTGLYDFSADGQYEIQYLGLSAHQRNGREQEVHKRLDTDGAVSVLESDRFVVFAQGRTGNRVTLAQHLAQAKSVSFSGRCSSSQQSTIQQAVSAAQGMASGSVSYLNGTPSAKPRYVTWFGAFSTSGWNTAKSHFVAIQDVLYNKAMVFDCSCKKKTTYAYVYPTQPYKVYLCGAFWSAPLTGTDSKGGTIVHEISHFDVVAGTDDYAYGQSAAKSLAISNPQQALFNADSHEYFAENTPALQ